MSADLVPKEVIPQLATRIDSPTMLRVLRHIEQARFIMNAPSLDRKTFDILQRLAASGGARFG
jgi:hypothetical protein